MTLKLRIRLLAGVRLDLGRRHLDLDLPDEATVGDLARELAGLGLGGEAGRVVVLLNGQPLAHHPQERPLGPDDDLSAFNPVPGG